MHGFHYYWDFHVESKVIILIVSDSLFLPLIDLCSAHLSAAHGITFPDRGRMADGQQMEFCLLPGSDLGPGRNP